MWESDRIDTAKAKAAKEEVCRFIKRIDAFLEDVEENPSLYQRKTRSAMRRSSLDVSDALINLRRPSY